MVPHGVTDIVCHEPHPRSFQIDNWLEKRAGILLMKGRETNYLFWMG